MEYSALNRWSCKTVFGTQNEIGATKFTYLLCIHEQIVVSQTMILQLKRCAISRSFADKSFGFITAYQGADLRP